MRAIDLGGGKADLRHKENEPQRPRLEEGLDKLAPAAAPGKPGGKEQGNVAPQFGPQVGEPLPRKTALPKPVEKVKRRGRVAGAPAKPRLGGDGFDQRQPGRDPPAAAARQQAGGAIDQVFPGGEPLADLTAREIERL